MTAHWDTRGLGVRGVWKDDRYWAERRPILSRIVEMLSAGDNVGFKAAPFGLVECFLGVSLFRERRTAPVVFLCCGAMVESMLVDVKR